jgi:glycosyltransferase involved in cell wall biosynthesis
VGRKPAREILEVAASDPKIRVTGTVPDVRPFLWGSSVSIVPLLAGGGTRLKIYESMAAGIPAVSTTIGAEGLKYEQGENIVISDEPSDFAERCLELLEDETKRKRIGGAGRDMVNSRFSWDVVARRFECLLQQ